MCGIRLPSLIVLLRHGKSLMNKAKDGSVFFEKEEDRKEVKDIPDYLIPLTPEGDAEAVRAGIELRKRFGLPDVIFHSGYARNAETTEKVLGAYRGLTARDKIAVRMNPLLAERDSGYCYHMTKDESENFFPWLQGYWKIFGSFFARPAGGERLLDVLIRVYLFHMMEFLTGNNAGKKVFIVGHGGVTHCFRFLFEEWDYEQALKLTSGSACSNCGITYYEFDSEINKMVLKGYDIPY